MPETDERITYYDALKIYPDSADPSKHVLTIEKWNKLVTKVQERDRDILEALTITPDKKVGLGNTTPERALHIKGNGGVQDDIFIESVSETNWAAGALIFARSQNDNSGTLLPPKTNDTLGAVVFRGYLPETNSYANGSYIQALAAKDFVDANKNSGDLRIVTVDNGKSVESIRFKANGNVGIGTAEPTHKLHVEGDLRVKNWVRVYTDRGLYFQNFGGGFHMTDTTWIRTYGNKSFYHNKGVMRTDGELQVGDKGNRFIVKSNGNVGIGTSSPSEKLHVKGTVFAVNLKASSNLTIGGKTILKGEVKIPSKKDPRIEEKLIQIRRFTPINNGHKTVDVNTKYETADWTAAVVGFTFNKGQIKVHKNDGKWSIKDFGLHIRMEKSGRYWHIKGDLVTHGQNEEWGLIDVMFIHRNLSDQKEIKLS